MRPAINWKADAERRRRNDLDLKKIIGEVFKLEEIKAQLKEEEGTPLDKVLNLAYSFVCESGYKDVAKCPTLEERMTRDIKQGLEEEIPEKWGDILKLIDNKGDATITVDVDDQISDLWHDLELMIKNDMTPEDIRRLIGEE